MIYRSAGIALSVLFLLTCTPLLKGQHQARFTQYYLKPILVNPGATGFENEHDLMVNYRNRWAGFDDAPRNYLFSYNGRITDNVGLGAMISSHNIGVDRRLRAQLSYSYKIKTEDLDMGIGLSTEFHQFKVSNDALTSPLTDNGDPILLDAADGAQYFDLTFGVYGRLNDAFYFGLSAPNLVRERLDEVEFNDEEDPESTFLKYVTLYLGYEFEVEDYGFKLMPSIFMKNIRNVPTQFDINLKMAFLEEQLIGGLTYSLGGGDRFGFLIGTQLEEFQFYYSYDLSFQDFQEYSNGSHEITVAYTIPGQKRMDEEKMKMDQ